MLMFTSLQKKDILEKENRMVRGGKYSKNTEENPELKKLKVWLQIL